MFHRKLKTTDARKSDVKVTLIARADSPTHQTDLLLRSFVQAVSGRTLRYVLELDGVAGRMIFIVDRGPVKDELTTGEITAKLEAYNPETDGQIEVKTEDH